MRIDPEVWARLAGCVERREAIRATYQTFDGRVSEYEIHPYHLLAYHGNWCLMAWSVEKKRVATFALSRFRRIEAAWQTLTRPSGFSPETYAQAAFGIVGGEEPINVRLLFEPKLAVYITERQWHPSQEFRARPDGRVGDAAGDDGTQGVGAVGPVLDAGRDGARPEEPTGSPRPSS